MNDQIRRALEELEVAEEELNAEIAEAYRIMGDTGSLVAGRLIRARLKIKKAAVRLASL